MCIRDRILFDFQNSDVAKTSYKKREQCLSVVFAVYLIVCTVVLGIVPSLLIILESYGFTFDDDMLKMFIGPIGGMALLINFAIFGQLCY